MTECFCQEPFENWFGRQISLGSIDREMIIQVWLTFGYNNNAIRNQKHFKQIVNVNVADSDMIGLTDEPLPCWQPKKERKLKFKCKS